MPKDGEKPFGGDGGNPIPVTIEATNKGKGRKTRGIIDASVKLGAAGYDDFSGGGVVQTLKELAVATGSARSVSDVDANSISGVLNFIAENGDDIVYPEPTGTKSITKNGTVDVKDYASAEVAVPASAVVDGSINITENGMYDVTEKASAEVAVPASAVVSGTKSITANGTHDVTNYASVNVSISAETPISDKPIMIRNNTGSTVNVRGIQSSLYYMAVYANISNNEGAERKLNKCRNGNTDTVAADFYIAGKAVQASTNVGTITVCTDGTNTFIHFEANAADIIKYESAITLTANN